MAKNKNSSLPFDEKRKKAFEACPHCGADLSPWEQVLLSVDRALMCKHCWYRILLDVTEDFPVEEKKNKMKDANK